MKKIMMGVFIAAVFALLIGMPAYAEEGTDSAWKVSVAPFIWFMGLEGTVTAKGHDADVNANFSDILDNLDMAGEINIEAGNNDGGVFVQPNYLKLEQDSTTTFSGTGIQTKSKVTSTTTFIEFGGFARLVDIKRETGGHNTIDLIGGLRYWDFSNELKFSVPAADVGRKVKKDGAILDPFVGLRMKSYLADKVLFSGRIDIGGLGTASSSNFTYNIVALLGYDVTQNVTVFGGYRVLSIEYGDSLNGVDAMIHGPSFGVNLIF